MADVAPSAGDDDLVAATAEDCRTPPVTETGGGDKEKHLAVANNGIADDNVSIHEILESMTNEFNKGMSLGKHSDNDKTGPEEVTTPPSPSKTVDETSKGEKECDAEEIAVTQEDVATPTPVPEQNHKDEEESSTVTDKQETVKKDNGINRIVLTFRTTDENTDHGKKTKISSCSNATLLTQELLTNYVQIDGVSVKLEDSTETESKTVDKDKTEDMEEKHDDTQELPPVQKKPETTERTTEKVESNNVEAPIVEGATEQQETITPVIRKRRAGRPKLRALRFFIFPYLPFVRCISTMFTNF